MKPFSNQSAYSLLFLAMTMLASCAGKITPWERVIPGSAITTIKLDSVPKHEVKLLYTGCGGMLIAYENEAILTDPFYTGHVWPKLVLGRIKIDTANTRKVLNAIHHQAKVDSRNINAVLIAHSHYDHLEDLPYLLDRNVLNQSVIVIGDTSTFCTISKFMRSPQHFVNADNIKMGWKMISPHMRVMMIPAAHAPHIGRHIEFMQGNTCTKGKLKKFDDPLEKTRGFKWKKGEVYSWLIDVLDDRQNIELRLFMQSSSCAPTQGFPPKQVLDEHKVDIAMIGVASSQNVDHYPDSLLKYLEPKKVVLIHWEDFFRDLYHKKTKTVRGTDVDLFFGQLQQLYKSKNLEELVSKDIFMMPKPLTLIEVKY